MFMQSHLKGVLFGGLSFILLAGFVEFIYAFFMRHMSPYTFALSFIDGIVISFEICWILWARVSRKSCIQIIHQFGAIHCMEGSKANTISALMGTNKELRCDNFEGYSLVKEVNEISKFSGAAEFDFVLTHGSRLPSTSTTSLRYIFCCKSPVTGFLPWLSSWDAMPSKLKTEMLGYQSWIHSTSASSDGDLIWDDTTCRRFVLLMRGNEVSMAVKWELQNELDHGMCKWSGAEAFTVQSES